MTSLKGLIRVGFVAAVLALTGCASTQTASNDPLEGYNRAMYKFNDAVDTVVLKPVAKGYDTIVPEPISQAISNFFSNLADIGVIINDLLQGKLDQAADDTGRFLLNSTVGFAGILDVATDAGLPKNNEDFGQTLGVWGVEPGAYVVLPLLGPRTVRDSFGLVGDYYSDPVTYVTGPGAENALRGTRLVDDRAELLKVENVLEEAALDEYSYVRDAYLQRRLNLVYDGNPPEDDFDVFSE